MNPMRLNSAGRVAQAFVDSKLTPLFVIAVLALAILAALITPREENPQIIVPGAQVTWLLPGSTPEEVERLIVAPMEAVLREIDGVKHTEASAAHGIGQVMIEFHVGVDEDVAIDRVRHRVAAHRSELPAATLEPRIEQIRVDDVPILTLTLASTLYDDYALRRLAERLCERLNTIEQVSVTKIHGGRTRELRIQLDPARLQAHGLTMNEGVTAITSNHLDQLAGESVRDGKARTVFLDARVESAAALARLPLTEHRGRLVRLEDVAEVTDGPAPEQEIATRLAFGSGNPRFSDAGSQGEMPAVTVSVAKKPNTNAVRVSRAVLALVERMDAEFIPEGVHVVVTRDDGTNADRVVNHVMVDLAIAISIVILVLVPTLGTRQALIVALVIPLVMGLTLAIDWLAGITINRVSMFGLIMALGMLVDDAIVVMENIHRHYESGASDRRQTAIIATNEIGNPTTLATITIVLVFQSLNLLTGMNGEFFFPVAFNVATAIAISLVVAYVVVPWACLRWLRHASVAAADTPSRRLEANYLRAVSSLVDHPRRANALFATIAVLLMGSTLMVAWQFIRPSGIEGPLSFGGVNLSIMPRENRNTFTIWIDMPEGTPVESTDRVARQVGSLLTAEPTVDNYLSWIGLPGVVDFAGQISGSGMRRGSNVAEIRVNLLERTERRTSSGQVIERLRAGTDRIRAEHPGVDIRYIESPAGPPSAAVILAHIHGPDPQVLRELSAEVRTTLQRTYGVVDVFDTQTMDRSMVDIVIDHDKAALSRVTVTDIARTLTALTQGMTIAETHLPGEKNVVPIRVRVPRYAEISPELLDRVLVRNADGDAVPLSEVTRVSTRTMDRPIHRRDNERVTTVGGNVTEQTAPFYAILAMDQKLQRTRPDSTPLQTGNLGLMPESPGGVDGYQLLWDGELRLTLDSIREMSMVFSVVLATIYLLLVAAYRSFLLPLLSMVAIPLGVIGVFPGHWLTGISFSMASLIGIVALAGVVIRNSLLIIDFIHDYQRQGHPLSQAVKLAGAVRLRPILLTATAVILAALVLYRDPLFAGLATSLIFGTLVSTVLTLVALPPMYERVARHFPDWAEAATRPRAAGE